MTVGPKLTIKGKIKPSTDEKGKTSMPPTIDVTQFVPINLEHERLSPVTRRISVDGQGHFTATDLLACETQVEAGGRTFKVNLDRPETSVTIDLTQRRITTRDAHAPGGLAGHDARWRNRSFGFDLCLCQLVLPGVSR